ncbi:hypothetical protein [Streptomyces sp. NBC_00154]|uniref:hypothetical protein n=1 Tax=Streptomyces sp. NBC_00154 TaxID=2975670 RepID=UPI00224F121A|nr:hypothetical protein [Streptomyces sp. NBC_00154]MCX5315598.1 hypothetical protein [Streptomyces sp. NBC_00154]
MTARVGNYLTLIMQIAGKILTAHTEGTCVTVHDAAGGVATTGNLGSSKYAEGCCIFKVAVDDVPKGEKLYQVEVAHRGKAQLGGMEAEDGKLATTLAQTSPHDWVPDLMAQGPNRGRRHLPRCR